MLSELDRSVEKVCLLAQMGGKSQPWSAGARPMAHSDPKSLGKGLSLSPRPEGGVLCASF